MRCIAPGMRTLDATWRSKCCPRQWRRTSIAWRGFAAKRRSSASLNHPNIGSIYGLVDSDGVRGLVLELVEGDTLRDMLTAAERGLPVDQAVRIARQIADALDAAHGQGIIHRDLKPANVKVTPSGLVKLLDFGLGKEFTAAGAAADSMAATAEQPHQFSRPGMVLGTVGYMSPEQVRAGPIDPRTDLFSGDRALRDETGQCPFVGPVATMVFDAILHGHPRPHGGINPNIPPALERVIVRLLEKDPAARYTSATEVSQALRALGGGRRARDRTCATDDVGRCGGGSSRGRRCGGDVAAIAPRTAGDVGLRAGDTRL